MHVGTGLCAAGAGGCATLLSGNTAPMDSAAYHLNDDGNLVVAINRVPQFADVGGAVKVVDDRLTTPLIVARVEANRFVAVSMKCTHGGMDVEYRHDATRFRCVSFGHSRFDLDGRRLSGPAEAPLPAYGASLDGDTLTVRVVV